MTTPSGNSTVTPDSLNCVNTGLTGPLAELRADLVDGWVIHRSALERGFGTLLFPGQALLLDQDGTSTAAAFSHGVPNGTWLSAATLIQDKRMTREILRKAGIPVPESRSFSLKRGKAYAEKFAERLGYPVVVKPSIGESTIEVMAGLQNAEQLHQAIEYLKWVPTERPSFTSASYAFTQILTPKTSTSTRTRPTYKFLVEEHVSGDYVRLLVGQGELLSAVQIPQGPWQIGEDARDLSDELSELWQGIVRQIWDAIPGVSVAAIDLVVKDWKSGDYAVVDVAERPWLHVQQSVSPQTMAELSDRLLLQSLGQRKLPLGQPVETIQAEFRWEGLSQVEADVERAREATSLAGLAMSIATAEPISGIVTGQIAGPAGAVAAFQELAIDGMIFGRPAMSVATRPLDTQNY